MPVRIERTDGYLTLAMELPKGNSIGTNFLDELNAALDQSRGEDVRAVIFTGKGKAFCAGLDLVETCDFDRPTLEKFVDRFEQLFIRVMTLPRPTVAAVNGHAIAGGCIFALACDRRVMADDPDIRIGINEVEIGIPFPAGAMEIARHGIAPEMWTDTFLEGRRLTPKEALEAKMVHKIVPQAELLAEALKYAERLAAVPTVAYAQVKRDLQGPLMKRIGLDRELRRRRFVEAWLGPASREKRTAIRDALTKKGK